MSAESVLDSQTSTTVAAPALEVSHLTVQYIGSSGWVSVVDDLSLSIAPGRTLGLVGESGCGKSTTALAVMDLLPRRGARISSGQIRVGTQELLSASPRARRDIRGRRMAMIFQEPMSSLNPAYTVGEQIAENVRLHLGLSRRAAWRRSIDALERVEIPNAAKRARDYPHTFSGGMLQRVMIASALSCEPSVLVADEPTTALDVTIQSQILVLLRRLQDELGMALLFITHDLAVMSEVCDSVIVMYAGQAIERATVDEFLSQPRHPYARGLLSAVPRVTAGRQRLAVIPGRMPAPGQQPEGCRFHPRCEYERPICVAGPPPLVTRSNGHADRCVRSEELVGELA